MSAFKNDGAIPYASRVLTITGTGAGSFIADNIEVDRPVKEINRTNELDEPSGSVNYLDFVTGTAQLQLATAATACPGHGAEFTTTFNSTFGAENFFITRIGQPFAKDGETKVNISFKKKYNA